MAKTDRIAANRPIAVHERPWGILAAAVSFGLLATIVAHPYPWLVWNASSSEPIGLYSVTYSSYPQTGDIVVAKVPDGWRELAARRRYVPINVPLVKRVVAEPGDTVCAMGADIFINARRVAKRRELDALGRPLRWWNGCKVLRNGALFLLTTNPSSFDGRYFGPTRRDDVVGKARLIWGR